MIAVEQMDLACGFLDGRPVFLLLDAQGDVAAMAEPGQAWGSPEGLPITPGTKAEDWIEEAAHPASLALGKAQQTIGTLMASAMLHVESRVAPLYEGATVEAKDCSLRVYARSGVRRASAGNATPRPRLRPRVDVWF